MRITFVATDPPSIPENSPTLWKTDRESWIVQGWIVTDPEALAQIGDIPEGETILEIPDRLVPFFFKPQEQQTNGDLTRRNA